MIELETEELKLWQIINDSLAAMDREHAMHGLAGNTKDPLREAGLAAHKLHISLKNRGLEPTHHAYMIRNRGVQPDQSDFYMQVHAIQDLISFVYDPESNKDPIDMTMGKELTFRVYSRRWKSEDIYRIKRIDEGWDVRHKAIGGPCDTGGHPFLFRNFEQDSISYPANLDTRLEYLWEEARDRGLSKEVVQKALQDLADWVSETERRAPSQGFWEGY
jgi:hypothetical protein